MAAGLSDTELVCSGMCSVRAKPFEPSSRESRIPMEMKGVFIIINVLWMRNNIS